MLIELLGHINIILIIFGGLLIVSPSKRTKIYGTVCYYLCNVSCFGLFFLTNLKMFLTSAIVFVIINTINLFRILKNG